MRSSIGNSIAVFFRVFCNVFTGGSIEGILYRYYIGYRGLNKVCVYRNEVLKFKAEF